jgi:predicted porin
MKKIAIAAALALTAGLASADVLVNGTVRYDIVDAKGADVTTGISRSEITIRATEDVGNGVKVTAGVGLNGAGRGETVEGFDSFITIAGTSGEVMVGQIEVANGLLARTQSLTPVIGSEGIVLGATANRDVFRYTSPAIGGFRVSLQTERDIVAAGSSAKQTYVMGADGKIGIISTRIDYTKDTERVRVSATTEVAGVTVGAGFSGNEQNRDTGAAVKNSWIVAGAVPVGPVSIGATYAKGNGKSKEIAARYDFSKRTSIAIAYRDVTENSNAARNIATTRVRVQHRF